MEKKEKKRFFTFKTTSGSLRFLALFVALIVVFSLLAQVITTSCYKINISDVVIKSTTPQTPTTTATFRVSCSRTAAPSRFLPTA